jgi:hypothetical protein
MHDQPLKAHQLTLSPRLRQPLGENLWGLYRNNARSRKELEAYVQRPLVRTLLALGPRPMVRFYETAGQIHDGNEDLVDSVFAVTYEEEGETKSFFVDVQAYRTDLGDGSAGWQILQTRGGVRPKGW